MRKRFKSGIRLKRLLEQRKKYVLQAPDLTLADALLELFNYREEFDDLFYFGEDELENFMNSDDFIVVPIKVYDDVWYAVYRNDGRPGFKKNEDMSKIVLDEVDFYTNYWVDGEVVYDKDEIEFVDRGGNERWEAEFDWEVIETAFKLGSRNSGGWASFVGFVVLD